MTVKHRSCGLLIAVIFLWGCSPAADGRKGNSLYNDSSYTAAADAFRYGLAALEDPESTLRTRYYNNLGLALYQDSMHTDAQEAFVQAAGSAEDNVLDRTTAAYNAGNNAYRSGQKKLATDFYVQALVADPANIEAKINYEFVKRQLENEEQEGDSQDEPPEPSEYARDLKRQAEELVEQRRYREAFQLMDEGRQIDPTVEAYATFIERMASVAQINEIPA